MNILFASTSEPPSRWIPDLEKALPQDRFVLQPAPNVDVALVAQPPPNTFERLPNLKLVQSLWMGIEHPKSALKKNDRENNLVEASERLFSKFHDRIEPPPKQ